MRERRDYYIAGQCELININPSQTETLAVHLLLDAAALLGGHGVAADRAPAVVQEPIPDAALVEGVGAGHHPEPLLELAAAVAEELAEADVALRLTRLPRGRHVHPHDLLGVGRIPLRFLRQLRLVRRVRLQPKPHPVLRALLLGEAQRRRHRRGQRRRRIGQRRRQLAAPATEPWLDDDDGIHRLLSLHLRGSIYYTSSS